ncbi:MAG: hypothetical protein HY917_05010 [Candidatus Diapherotrites archaeon]|nr:hypothetical protein [Candidatus Diapherotrites archaeon]
MPPKRIKPMESIHADHASVSFLPSSHAKELFGKTGIVARWDHYPRFSWVHKITPRYSTAMSIAWLLYPREFPKPIAYSLDGAIAYSKRVPLTAQSEQGIRNFYDPLWPRTIDPLEGSMSSFFLHNDHVSDKALNRAKTLYQNSGLLVNVKPMNVGERRNGKPVFFEVTKVSIPVLERRISLLPNQTPNQRIRKAQLLSLLEELRKWANGEPIVSVHDFLRR